MKPFFRASMLVSILIPLMMQTAEGRTYDSLELALESPESAVALKLIGNAPADLSGIRKLTGLEVLQLRNCSLKKLPQGLGDLKKLRLLILSGNQLTDLPAELAGLESLEYLYLEDNQLASIPDVVTKLPSLKAIYLTRNVISNVPDKLAGIRTLKLVTLGGNPVASDKAKRNRTNRVLAGVLVTY